MLLMNILHTSDLHLGKSLYEVSLVQDQDHIINQIIEYVDTQKADLLIIAGDIYDRAIPSLEAVGLYDKLLSAVVGERKVPVAAIAGNHDSAERMDFGRELYLDSGYYIAGTVGASIRKVVLQDQYGPVDLYLLPYLEPADLRGLFPGEPVRTFQDAYRLLLEQNAPSIDPSHRNLLVAHGFFSGLGQENMLLTSDSELRVGGMDVVDSGLFSPFDYVALGHLHACQKAGRDTVRYSGSPLKYSLSEQDQQKGILSVTLREKGQAEVHLLPLSPLHDLRTIKGFFEELIDPSFHRDKPFDDYVFAEIQDTLAIAYPMEKLRTLFPNILGLRFSHEDGESEGWSPSGMAMAKRSPEELFADFYRSVHGSEISPQELELLRQVLCAVEKPEKEEPAYAAD